MNGIYLVNTSIVALISMSSIETTSNIICFQTNLLMELYTILHRLLLTLMDAERVDRMSLLMTGNRLAVTTNQPCSGRYYTLVHYNY